VNTPALSHLSITELVHRFRATKSLPVLALLAATIVRQRRTVELLYSGHCSVFHPPSPVHRPEDPEALERILGRRVEFAQHAVLNREQLMRASSAERVRHPYAPLRLLRPHASCSLTSP
jgi:hypothetical protein